MKRFPILLLFALFCAGAAAYAADSAKPAGMKLCKGTVLKMDKTAKTMTMKAANGQELSCSWDDSTKVTGEMKEGAMAIVHCEMHGDKMVATEIRMMGEKKDKK